MSIEIVVLKTAASNAKSVEVYLQRLGYRVETKSVQGFRASPGIALVLPGVGSFGPVMRELETSGAAEQIKLHAEQGGSVIGICLGMHLFFESSEEFSDMAGIGLMQGHVRSLERFLDRAEIPQIGWAPYDENLPGDEVYFAHSYFVDCSEDQIIHERMAQNFKYPTVVSKKGLLGVQFHPEKSKGHGDELIRSFLRRELANGNGN